MKLIQSIPRETDDVTSDFDNIVANAKDCGILFILLLGLWDTIRSSSGIKQIDFTWPCACTLITHRGPQNVAKLGKNICSVTLLACGE